jgi:hypothetical protein
MADISYQFLARADSDAPQWTKDWIAKLSATTPFEVTGMSMADLKALLCKLWRVDPSTELRAYKRYNGPRTVVLETEQLSDSGDLYRDPSVEDACIMLLPSSPFLDRLTKLERMAPGEISEAGGPNAVLGSFAFCDVQRGHIIVKASTPAMHTSSFLESRN